MRILFFTKGNTSTPSSRQRIWFIAERLGLEHKIIWRTREGFPGVRELWQNIRANDVLFVHKSLFPWRVVALVLFGKIVLRKKFIYDLDDAEWVHSPVKSFLFARYANRILCGSQAIVMWATRYNRRTTLIPTVVDHDVYARFKVDHKEHGTYTIGWAGTGKGHFLDGHFKMIYPALNALATHTHFRFVIIGSQNYQPLKDYFANASFETIFVDNLEWGDPTAVASQIHQYQFDVGLMSTSDSLFNRAKCAFKAIEYMACGVPVVTSPVGENTVVVKDGENGFYARNDVEWASAIEKLLRNKDIRIAIGKQNIEKIKNEYSYEAMIPKYHALIKAL